MKILKVITWDHSRGYVPLVATSQRFSEINPDIRIIVEKQSLQNFADVPIDLLAKEYDLIIFDHPHISAIASTNALLPLNKHLPTDFLDDQRNNQVGNSHHSYFFQSHQWGLAID